MKYRYSIRHMFLYVCLLLSVSITHTQNQNESGVGAVQSIRPYALQCLQTFDQMNLYTDDFNDAIKMIIVLRSADVPRESRKQLALRVLRGDFFTQPDTREQLPSSALTTAAVIALSHLCINQSDAEVLQSLEQYLTDYERYKEIQSLPDHTLPENLKLVQRRLSVDPDLVRAIVCRLKAVRQNPQMNTSADLERRIRAIIREAGFTPEELRARYEEDRERNRSLPHPKPSYAEYLVEEIERTVFHAVCAGMDREQVEQVLRRLSLNLAKSTIVGRPAGRPRPLVEIAETARDPALLVDEIIRAEMFPALYAQLLVDWGVSVVPIIVSKLEKLDPPNPTEGTTQYRWLPVLFRVLINLLGPDKAVPVIEAIAPDSGEKGWLAPYAREAKESAKQGRVFSFYYVF